MNIAAVVHLPIDELPFRYLDVPLSTKRLNYTQCKILVEKIIEKAQSWMAKTLSYASRLQLVWSILSSMLLNY